MPIISKIGRKSFRVRLLIGSMYAILILGAITMLYPFSLMVAGSTKSAVDTPDAVIIPAFLVDDVALYRKDAEGFFNESLVQMQIAWATNASSFRVINPPAGIHEQLVADWTRFLATHTLPYYFSELSYIQSPRTRGVMPLHLRRFKKQLLEEFNGDIETLNLDLGTEFRDWNAFFVQPRDYLPRMGRPLFTPFFEKYRRFKLAQPPETRYVFSVEAFYRYTYLKAQYGKNIEDYNAAHGTHYTSWNEVHLTRRLPGEGYTDPQREDWISFVQSVLNLFWIRADHALTGSYRDFLKAKYRDIHALNEMYETEYASFDDIPLVEGEPPREGLILADWDSFFEGWKDPDTGELHQANPAYLSIYSVDFLFRDYLRERYGDLAAFNRACGTSCTNWLEVLPPQRDYHYHYFLQQKSALRREFVARNFISVFEYIVLHGRAVLNSVIYCSLAVLCALLVNPLAAYALSRYKPPSAYKVLLFLMLTMAFPPMVTQIPAFLMLREFGLLNTFWALILPGMANGYSIFLLKGFFDSLPQELYESASIDGAGEFRIFWQITMSLSKPILAVIALNAFTVAYSNFMMALLICQDQKMWTLMPWLYQLQQSSGQGVIFASLLVAAVPTFLIFVFCQNIIMRGIVVPVEK